MNSNTAGVPPITSSVFTFKDRVLWVLLDSGGLMLTVDEIHEFLTGAFRIPATKKKIRKALDNSGQNIIRNKDGTRGQYGISHFGEQHLKSQSGPIQLFHISGKKPYTDQSELNKLPNILKPGPFFVVDKYYGQSSFDFLLSLSAFGKVSFLTALPAGKASKATLRISALRLMREAKGRLEIKIVADKSALHDRYIVSKKFMVLLGHGLANFGEKESFMVILDNNSVKDIKNDLQKNFAQRWATAVNI